MRDRFIGSLIFVIVVALIALFIAAPFQKPAWLSNIRNLELRQGLDLQGGLQVLLEADVSEGATVTNDDMDAAKVVVENRVNGLGVAEPIVQRQGEDRIIIELPGIDNPDQAVETLKGTGLLEFVEMGNNPLPQGTLIQTDGGGTNPENGLLDPTTGELYHTVMTGAQLENAAAQTDQLTGWLVAFELDREGTDIFSEYTASHIGQVLGIVLDKVVLSSPVIQSRIDGNGTITGSFTAEEARSLAIQMRYGALPVPLKVIDTRTVGASLGKDSVDSSIKAGAIGLLVVLLYMLAYYRLPGFLADLALIIFVLINIALFKLIPITLTLPGIAGFLLATGTAVDANILIFERMKEELRAGKPLRAAVDAGFERAWTSILDSNLSTLITCAILWFFGGAFGASAVRGFAFTLGLGVATSMFTAVFVTRTFMRAVFYRQGTADAVSRRVWLLGV